MADVSAQSKTAPPSVVPPETLAFLEALYPDRDLSGLIELRCIYEDKKVSKPVGQEWFSRADLIASPWDRWKSANAAGFGTYFGPGLRRARSGKEEDVTAIPAIWADVDAKDFDPDDVENGKRLALEFIRTKLPPGLQPSIIVDSGRGFHLYWLSTSLLLLNDETQRQRVRAIMAGLADLLNGDAVHDLGRFLRLPGTLNVKDPAKPRSAVIIKADYDWRFEITAFDSFAISPDRMRRAESVVFNATMPAIDLKALRISDRIRSLIQGGKTAGDKYASRSEADAAVALAMVNGKHSDDEIRAVFSNPEWRIGERCRERGEGYLRRTIAKVRAFAESHPLERQANHVLLPATSPGRRQFSYPLSTIFNLDHFPKALFIVEQLIREASFGFIAGEPKRLKSWLALYLALIIAAGEKAFGHFATGKPRRVMFIEEEDDVGTVRDRIELFQRAWTGQWPSDEFFRFAVRTGIGLHPAKEEPDDLNSQFDSLLAEIAAFRPEVIFFDAFNRVHDGDENNQKDMSRVMGRFEEIRRNFGCAVVLVHHFNKMSPGKSSRGSQRLRGSSVLSAWSENSLFVMARDADNTLRIDPESKHAATDPFAIRLEQVAADGDRHGLRFVYSGNPTGRKQTENRERVFTALTELHRTMPDACTIKTLAARLGMSATTVRNCLDELKDLKRVSYTLSKIGGKGQSQHVWHPLINPEKDAQSHE